MIEAIRSGRRRVWLPATETVGVEGLSFHDLRHSGATLAAATGANTRELGAARAGDKAADQRGNLVELKGLEPSTPCLQSRCSSN